MYTLNVLNDSTAAKYEHLTYPIFRSRLEASGLQQSIVAIGASFLWQPVGLAMAEISPDGTKGEVLSIFVTPQSRCAGIGTSLLTCLEQELFKRGCTGVKLDYITGKPTTPALERLLQKCNWVPPQPRMLVCKSTIEMIVNAPWMHRYSLPSSFTIFPLTELTEDDRLSIQQRQVEEPWIPQDLIPFRHEENLEPLNSVGLRYKGEVVGWVITHRLDPDTIRYTCSFVRLDLQKMGRIIPLYVEAIKRQYQANILKGIWTVPFCHTAMINFVKRRMADYMESIEESRGSFKLI